MKKTFIILHHSASPQNQTAQAIDNYHKKKWNFKSSLGKYAGYQYIVSKYGTVSQHRSDTEAGAHCKEKNMNYKSIGICVTGWYDDGHNTLPTKAQQTSLGALLRRLMDKYGIPRENVKFHRDYNPKTCPGLHITQQYIDEILGIKKKEMFKIKDKDYDLCQESLKRINKISHREHEKNWSTEVIDTFNEGKHWDAFRYIMERPWKEVEEREEQRKSLGMELKAYKEKNEILEGMCTDLQSDLDSARNSHETARKANETCHRQLEVMSIEAGKKHVNKTEVIESSELIKCLKERDAQIVETKKLKEKHKREMMKLSQDYNVKMSNMVNRHAKKYSTKELLSMLIRKITG